MVKSKSIMKEQQLMDVLTEADNMRDFIKLSAIDFKIDRQVANELLNYLDKINDIGLK